MATSTQIKLAGSLDAPTALGALNPLWTPSLLPGIAAAWDADTVTADTSTTPPQVTAWPSTFGGLTLTGAAGSYPTKEGALNGKVPVRFTANRKLATPLVTFGGAPLFACLINLAAAPTTGQTIWSSGDGRFNMSIAANGQMNLFLGSATTPANIITPAGTVKSGNNLVVLYPDADGKHQIRVNGVDIVSATVNYGATSTAGGSVGIYPNNTAPLADAGICAILFAGGQQTLTNIQKLEGYLAQRFVGTTFLPVGHPYRSIPPRKLS